MKRNFQSIVILTSLLSRSDASPTARVESASHGPNSMSIASTRRTRPSKTSKGNQNETEHETEHGLNQAARAFDEIIPSQHHHRNEYARRRLHSIANSIMYSSSETLSQVLQGTVAGRVPADLYGQTLQQEISNCPFTSSTTAIATTTARTTSSTTNGDGNINLNHNHNGIMHGKIIPGGDTANGNDDHQDVISHDILKSKEFSNLMHPLQDRKLYGGAQYHRTLQSFHHLIYNLPIDEASSDEIALLIHGVSDTRHDGEDLLRSVAILSSAKMEKIMDTLLIEMARRVEFVMLRMWEVVDFSTSIVRGWKTMDDYDYDNDYDNEEMEGRPPQSSDDNDDDSTEIWNEKMIRKVEKDIKKMVKDMYGKFVREKVTLAYNTSVEDIRAMFRFVSWDLALGGANGSRSLINIANGQTQRQNFHEWDILDEDDDDDDVDDDDDGMDDGEDLGDLVGGVLNQGHTAQRQLIDSHIDTILMEVIEAVQATESLCQHPGQSLGQTGAAVNVLVQHVTKRWRIEIAQIVMTKFNSLCLQPLHDEFGAYLRREMNVYIEKLGEEITSS